METQDVLEKYAVWSCRYSYSHITCYFLAVWEASVDTFRLYDTKQWNVFLTTTKLNCALKKWKLKQNINIAEIFLCLAEMEKLVYQ